MPTTLRQVLRLPKTLLAIWKIVKQDYAVAALDENLWTFWGFYQDPEQPHCRSRTWQKVKLALIGPQDVVGLPVSELALMMNVSMELEEPILEYSSQNGEGFRFLLPNLARFMGINREEADYAAAHGLAWCQSPWCAEERRHAGAFARMIERLTKTSPRRDNPNRPMIVTPEEEDAVRLVLSREAAEWNSSSTYIVMAAHAKGYLGDLLRNVARDEIKHLTILSAADQYLFGPRPWRRFVDLVRNSLREFGGQKKNRTGGQHMGTNAVTAVEVIVSHLLTESCVRRWLRTIPLATLESIFETQSNLSDLAARALPPDRQAQLEETSRKGREKRFSLARWAPGSRHKALEQRAFEQHTAQSIEKTIAAEIGAFTGAETPGSRMDGELRRKIRNRSTGMLRTILLGRLRDFQIRNNRYLLSRDQAA